MINLKDCVKGQLLFARNGRRFVYIRPFVRDNHLMEDARTLSVVEVCNDGHAIGFATNENDIVSIDRGLPGFPLNRFVTNAD
jgi:hypothetical protein